MPSRSSFTNRHPRRPNYSGQAAALLLVVVMLSACGGGWVPAGQVPTTIVSETPTLLPTPTEFTPIAETAPGEVTIISESETPTAQPTPSATAKPTITGTPLAPEQQIATLLVEWEGTPTPGPAPTRTRTPTRTPTRTSTPTITPTPLPPYGQLRIARPGHLSKVTSPLRTEMFVKPGEDGQLHIDLIGEDGRYITRQLLNYSQYMNRNIGITPEISFEIAAVAETARLSVSTVDKFGRTIALTSLDLILLSFGEDEINPPVYQQEPYIVREPKPDAVITGGTLRLSALARPVNDSALIAELISETGQIIAGSSILVPPPTGDLSHTPFTLQIPYAVTDITPARLTIRQASANRILGTVALYSQLVVLAP